MYEAVGGARPRFIVVSHGRSGRLRKTGGTSTRIEQFHSQIPQSVTVTASGWSDTETT